MDMRSLLMALVLTAGLNAPALAEPAASAPASASAEPAGSQQEGATARGDSWRLCPRDVPTIDYRACVNSSTRDKNSKVRQA